MKDRLMRLLKEQRKKNKEQREKMKEQREKMKDQREKNKENYIFKLLHIAH